MTKGKKWTLRLLGVAALALLVSLCLMGSTMARYTSQGTGNGTLTVALWDLEVKAELETTESISPSNLAYDDESLSGSARTNQSSWMVAFSIKNDSAVNAYVNVALYKTTGVSFSWYDSTKNSGFTWGTGWGQDNGTNTYGAKLMAGFGTSSNKFNGGDYYGEEAFKQVVNDNGIFSIKLAYEKTDGSITLPDETTKIEPVTSSENNGQGVLIESEKSLTFYAEVVWTSIYGGTNTCPDPVNKDDEDGPAWTDWASYSDCVDTILGMYCASIDFAVTWTAVQASVQPDPNAETGAP